MDAVSQAGRRAAAFHRMRQAHSTELAEDYVELVGDLIERFGEARLTDIAAHIGVTHATAAKVIQRLQREGLVETQPYRSIFLTKEGRSLADRSRARHEVVKDFLLALGLDPLVAEADSEGMEHHVSDATLDALAALTDRLREGSADK